MSATRRRVTLTAIGLVALTACHPEEHHTHTDHGIISFGHGVITLDEGDGGIWCEGTITTPERGHRMAKAIDDWALSVERDAGPGR